MPVFHTKTIESILEPVANQVQYSVLSRHTLISWKAINFFSSPPSVLKSGPFTSPSTMSNSKNNFLERSRVKRVRSECVTHTETHTREESEREEKSKNRMRKEKKFLIRVVAVRGTEDKIQKKLFYIALSPHCLSLLASSAVDFALSRALFLASSISPHRSPEFFLLYVKSAQNTHTSSGTRVCTKNR
jgi:hypothetical protein